MNTIKHRQCNVTVQQPFKRNRQDSGTRSEPESDSVGASATHGEPLLEPPPASLVAQAASSQVPSSSRQRSVAARLKGKFVFNFSTYFAN